MKKWLESFRNLPLFSCFIHCLKGECEIISHFRFSLEKPKQVTDANTV